MIFLGVIYHLSGIASKDYLADDHGIWQGFQDLLDIILRADSYHTQSHVEDAVHLLIANSSDFLD